MKLRILALFLALLMLASVFAGCTNIDGNTNVKETGEPAITTAAPTTEAVTTNAPSSATQAPSTSELPPAVTTTEAPNVTTNAPEPTPTGISLNGVLLKNYKVIYPSKPTVFENYAVTFFIEMIREKTGIRLNSASDAAAEGEYEILVGNTSRDESSEAPESGYYSLFTSGTKIVCNGQYHLVGAGLYEIAESIPNGVENIALNVNSSQAPRLHTYKEAKSVILVIGDGMGFNTIEMAKANGTCPDFYAEALPVHGKASTDNVYGQTTDSAAGGTALATGVKTVNGYLGVDQNGESLKNVRELAHEKGAKTAVITTDALTDATPSAFLTHHTSRNDSSILQSQITALTSAKKVDYCKGSLVSNLLTYTRTALRIISEDDSSFFIMIEEGFIDTYSHSNNESKMSNALKQMNSVVAYCMAFTVFNPETALIVTADHETGGIQNVSGSFVYTSKDHTSALVPIYACGAGTEVLNKTVKNTDTADFLFSVFE